MHEQFLLLWYIYNGCCALDSTAVVFEYLVALACEQLLAS